MADVGFSESELDALAGEVDQQLRALQAAPPEHGRHRRLGGQDAGGVPAAPAQEAVIEKATGERFETFWQKYLRHARRDLCLPGGALHDQWKKWRDLESKSAVRMSYFWLVAMGIPTASLGPAAVAASVFLINAVLNIGIEAVCEGCAEEEKTRAKELKASAEDATKTKKNRKTS